MVYSLRNNHNICATQNKNHFLGVVLKAFNATTAMSADLSPNQAGSSITKNLSSRSTRRTRYVVAELVEESSPSSQSTTFTALTSSASDVSSFLSPNITPILSSTTRNPASSLGDFTVEAADQSTNSDSANKSNFFLTLGACIDDIVFEYAYYRKGVSLFVIKKYLKEKYSYDTRHFRKSIRNYIVEALANGQLEQVSGRGASGSVRLSRRYRRKFMRAKHQLDSFSVDKMLNKTRSIKNIRKTRKTISNLSVDTFIKATHPLNLTNTTSIRLNRRLNMVKRKTKSLHLGNVSGQLN